MPDRAVVPVTTCDRVSESEYYARRARDLLHRPILLRQEEEQGEEIVKFEEAPRLNELIL